jgi:hypothetical protein
MGAKVIAVVALHYGAEYLEAAIKAIEPFVEKIIILYSEAPSYGFTTYLECPESREELRYLCFNTSKKIEWYDIISSAENHHRGFIYRYAEGFDGILTFDADEVFEPADVQGFIDYCNGSDKRYFGVDGYVNFWKSFNHACYDGFRPIRYVNLHNKDGEDLNAKCRIYHFSTAQKMEIMRYKLEIHGHKREIKKNWLRDIYESWPKDQSLHLVSNDIWLQAVPFDKNGLPQLLKDHGNFGKGVIL